MWPGSKGDPEYSFGFALDMSDKWLVAGQRGHVDSDRRPGSVFVFSKLNDTWVQHSRLDGEPGDFYAGYDRFGWSVAVEDDLLAVGAPAINTVFLYSIEGVEPSLIEQLTPARTHGDTHFGERIAMRDGVLVVSAPGDFRRQGGAIYIYDLESRWAAGELDGGPTQVFPRYDPDGHTARFDARRTVGRSPGTLLYDVSGRKVGEWAAGSVELSGRVSVDLGRLAVGAYLVLITADGTPVHWALVGRPG